ncbi:SRPBCC domain-containing protein [Blastopirellula marina]|uniref:Polyketide cyclase n=1 Tax=Blastopirellula marina TaxID=124 RepID=A0A2S8F238_9BACT|nr:SRPBCC domain-containing protein [Blastopirellula marina]PQO26245.1 polyketide cyclase [Blastopirellula marina]PQO47127.1 polyketide cyclase [Blastopirellula marina]PTL40644.1 polyketide cyclase [Blastopirellula marina]
MEAILRDVPEDRILRLTRELPFTAEQLFAAFRDPETLAAWWGPSGFTNTFHEFDFQPGGYWRFVMHGPDGKNYQNDSRFLEITEPTEILFRHLSAPHFQTTIRYEPLEQGCRLDWQMAFDDAHTRDAVAKFAGDGLAQNVDRLTATLSARLPK